MRSADRAVPIWLKVDTIPVDEVSMKNLLASLAQFCRIAEVGSPSVLTCEVFATKWQLSFTQLAATVSAIAIAVSIIATASISRLRTTGDRTKTAGTDVSVSKPASAADIDGRVRQQQFDINYWNQRVELRKGRWSSRVRDAFEKNLSAVDRAVMESRQQLMQNPHDEISEEMLNAALNEKMELLKDFSDQ